MVNLPLRGANLLMVYDVDFTGQKGEKKDEEKMDVRILLHGLQCDQSVSIERDNKTVEGQA